MHVDITSDLVIEGSLTRFIILVRVETIQSLIPIVTGMILHFTFMEHPDTIRTHIPVLEYCTQS